MNRITSPLGRGRNRHPIPGEGTPLSSDPPSVSALGTSLGAKTPTP